MKTSIGVAILCMSASSIYAQSVSMRVLASWDSQFRPRGDRPALHNGLVAFLGDESGPDPTRWAVFRGPLDGSLPFTPIAYAEMTRGDTVPWRADGAWFVAFGNPVVWGDSVYFDADCTNNGTGTLAAGAVVSLPGGYSSLGASLGSPSAGSRGFAHPVSFRDYAQSIVQVIPINAALPGGGTSASTGSGRTQGVVEGWAYGGEYSVHTTRVNSPFGYRYGIYAWQPATSQLSMVVNPWSTIPGTSSRLTYITGVDTDGVTVSFSGYSGAIGGVFTTPISGGGPITQIAAIGETSPFGLPYYSLGSTAIVGDVVFFDAAIGDISSGAYAVFASCRGRVMPVYKTGDVIDGKIMADGRVSHRGVDGNDMVMWARYQLPGGPGGVGVMLLHVHIDCMAACRADFNSDDAVDFFDYLDFVEAFSSGAVSADFNSDGAVDFFDYLDFVGEFSSGC